MTYHQIYIRSLILYRKKESKKMKCIHCGAENLFISKGKTKDGTLVIAKCKKCGKTMKVSQEEWDEYRNNNPVTKNINIKNKNEENIKSLEINDETMNNSDIEKTIISVNDNIVNTIDKNISVNDCITLLSSHISKISEANYTVDTSNGVKTVNFVIQLGTKG